MEPSLSKDGGVDLLTRPEAEFRMRTLEDNAMQIPPRSERMKAWTALMRQSEYLMGLSESWKYGEVRNAIAGHAASEEARALRNVADYLREMREP